MPSVGPPQSGHGTKMPPRADHEPGLELAVDNRAIARLFQPGKSNALVNARTAAREYSCRSISSSSTTGGVIHPPHTLSRGKICRSRITTLKPESRSFQAQELPAGPAPTIRTSHTSIWSPALRAGLLYTGALGSTEFAGRQFARKRFETVAACRHETRRQLRRGTAARLS